MSNNDADRALKEVHLMDILHRLLDSLDKMRQAWGLHRGWVSLLMDEICI